MFKTQSFRNTELILFFLIRAEDAEREKRLAEEAEEKRKEEARKKKKKEEKEKKKKEEEAKKKAEAAIYDPFGLGWHKPGEEGAAGKKGGKKDRKKGGFDFLLFQKKAGLQVSRLYNVKYFNF